MYEVSDLGRIKRIGNSSRGCMTKRGPHLLRPGCDMHGYRQFKLHNAPKHPKLVKVHRVVMEAFVGPMPAGMQVNHKDRNKDNNGLANLEYVTAQQNITHAVENGGRNSPMGEAHGMCKLTEDQARYIKNSTEAWPYLAARFNIRQAHVGRIKSGKRWSHLS